MDQNRKEGFRHHFPDISGSRLPLLHPQHRHIRLLLAHWSFRKKQRDLEVQQTYTILGMRSTTPLMVTLGTVNCWD